MKLSPILFIAFISFCSVQSKAQSGCTDPEATNFDPLAKTNDGSCVYPITNNSPILRANLGIAINETSGLVLTDGQLWTHQDSGGPNALFKIDSTSGLVKQIVYVDNYSNVDWEDIAADKDYIYIAETGNNNGTRKDLKILKIAKADIGSTDTVHLNAQAIQFSYADQTTFTSFYQS